MCIPGLQQYMLSTMEAKLPQQYVYHCVEHTKAVIAFSCVFGKWAKLSKPDIRLVSTAALLHDFGYIHSCHDNESIAANYAREILPQYAYPEADVEQIERMILATRMPCHPETVLEKILCDADLWHLGYPAHFHQACLLRQEKKNGGIVCEDDSVWCQEEIDFLAHHRYFTAEVESQLKTEKVNNIRMFRRKKLCNYSEGRPKNHE